MISNEDYMKKILQQVLDSYEILHNLQDKPGDLDVIKKELLKINGFFNVILKKFAESNFQLRSLTDLQPKINSYLKSYYFVQEIDTMTSLYSDDSSRIKNMRIKIFEAFHDKKLINKIVEVLEEL